MNRERRTMTEGGKAHEFIMIKEKPRTTERGPGKKRSLNVGLFRRWTVNVVQFGK